MARKPAYKKGDVIGDITLIDRVGNYRTKLGYPVFKCRCSCGKYVYKAPSALAQRVKQYKRNSASCCDDCEPGKGYESKDLDNDQIWRPEKVNKEISFMDRMLRAPIVRSV